MSEMQNMEFPDFLYSCNCNLSKQTKEWLSLMSLADFSDLIKVSQKYESTILCIDQLWNRHLSIEYIFLILYLGECLDLPQAVIKYIFVNKGLNHDIDSIELAAALISDFDLKDVESIEYHYSNSIYYFKAVAEVFSIHKLPSYSDMSYIVIRLINVFTIVGVNSFKSVHSRIAVRKTLRFIFSCSASLTFCSSRSTAASNSFCSFS